MGSPADVRTWWQLVPGSAGHTTDAFYVATGALLAETEPPAVDLVVASIPLVDRRVSSSAAEGYLVVAPEDLDPGGVVSKVTHGFLRAGHRDGNEQRVPMEPGTPDDLHLPPCAAHHRRKAGHRPRLRVASRPKRADEPGSRPPAHSRRTAINLRYMSSVDSGAGAGGAPAGP